MAMELVKLNSETLPAIANAIRAKTGDTALLRPSEMAAAIAGIPTGGDLPELNTPAAEKDVLAGKEYIDGSGAKKAGTLVVCDTVQEAGIVRNPGTGLEVDLQSTADGSDKTLTLPEPNLKSENIKSGVSIFGIAGSVKGIRTETGTITPAEDAQALELPCTANPKMVIVHLTDASLETVVREDMVAAMRANFAGVPYELGPDSSVENVFATNLQYHNTGGRRGRTPVTCKINPVKINGTPLYKWLAGLEYRWAAYYWEDDA